MQNKIKIFDIMILAIIILTVLEFMNNNIISKLIYYNYTYIYLGGVLVLLVIYLNNNKFKINMVSIISITIISIHSVLANYFNQNINGSIIMFIGTILYILYMKEKKYTKFDFWFFIIIFTILGFYSSIKASESAKYYLYNSSYFNPNLIGQIIFISAIMINSCGLEIKIKKAFLLFINAVFLVGLYNSESRSCLIIAIMYLLIIYIRTNKKTYY